MTGALLEIENESIIHKEADPDVPNEDAAPRPSYVYQKCNSSNKYPETWINDHYCQQKKI